jgi:hypothetical protein
VTIAMRDSSDALLMVHARATLRLETPHKRRRYASPARPMVKDWRRPTPRKILDMAELERPVPTETLRCE